MKICRITSSVLSVLLAALILASCSGNKETDVNDGETNGITVSDEAEIKTLPDPTEEELAEYAERIEALRKNHTEVGYVVEDRGENAIKATNIFGFSIEQGGTWVDYEEAKILPVPDFKNPFLTFANADSREVETRCVLTATRFSRERLPWSPTADILTTVSSIILHSTKTARPSVSQRTATIPSK